MDAISKLENSNFGFMIAGNLLPKVFSSKKLTDKFLKIIKTSRAVAIFRSSPSQKADIVKLVRSHIKGSITLSIGDGSNDVNMIQSAHVGIGLFGKEGNQAAAFSDYAIP